MLTSLPASSSMPSSLSLRARTRSICARSWSGETSLPNPCVAEWSVIARYSNPRSRAANAISSSVARPSDAVVWACRPPRRPASLTRSGSPHRGLPDGHVVLLVAGEVLEQVAELVGGDDLQVDRKGGVGASAGAGLRRPARRLHDVQLAQRLRERHRLVGGGDHVEVLDRVGQPPGRPGRLHPVGGVMGAQRVNDGVARVKRLGQQQPQPGDVAGVEGGERGEDVLLRLGPEPAHPSDRLRGGRLAQSLDRVDVQFVVEDARALGAEARHRPRHLDQPDRELGAQLLGRGRVAGLEQGDDLVLQRLADAWQQRGLAGERQRGHRGRALPHRLGRGAVGDDPVDDRAVELVEVSELVQGRGDLAVGEVRHAARLARVVWRSQTPTRVRRRVPAPAWLILPTYNEADNIEPIVRAALDVIRANAGDDHRVLIVDDASPDGTGAIADRLAAELPDELEVLHRPAKSGLGRAYLAGFRRALDAGAALVCEMDAD